MAGRAVDADNATAMAKAVLLMMDLFISASSFSNEDASATYPLRRLFPLDCYARRAETTS
ncbi:hypothetical protein CUJ84_Chr002280 [Rhizobium leguminosarum]|jgi:hypothetical protein|uniref:Uncharacterized protein n=1 Tax=Rhizobium leguminosarum TaxID=384 RepID=A0A2K9Z383_RHILE|nr:hypothetical protein CUJ84_Chr002280 [Rhizobium leguminosarum]